MEKTLIRILDIDLDFFIYPTDWPDHHTDRNENRLQPWREIDVQNFLEKSCGLSKSSPIKGKIFEEHHEVYQYCKKIIHENTDETQFIIDHIDAHADLGFGNNSVNSLHQCFSPCSRRGWITNELEKTIGLNRGNFLLFLIAQGWVFELNYINHAQWKFHDIIDILINKRDDRCDQICVFFYPEFENILEVSKKNAFQSNGKCCDFFKIDYRLFNNPHTYDYVFLTRSPNFSPPSSDALVPIFEQYMDL